MKKYIVFSLLFLLLVTSTAFANSAIITLKLVHPDYDRLCFLPPSEAKVDKKIYEHFEKDKEHFYVSRKVELDLTDMKEAKLEVLTPPSKKEIEALSKKQPNTLISLEPTYNVTISLNGKGREKLSKLTEKNIMRRLSIIFKGRLLIAPIIREKITGGSVVVSGINDYDEAIRLRDTINNRQKN